MSSREPSVPLTLNLPIQEWEDLADICAYWLDMKSTRFHQPRHDQVARYIAAACEGHAVSESRNIPPTIVKDSAVSFTMGRDK